MRNFRKFSTALILCTVVASGMVGMSTPLSANGGGAAPSAATICRALATAEGYLSLLPDGALKSYLSTQIDAQQSAYHCN